MNADRLVHGTFAPHVLTTFRVVFDGGAVELVLTAVSALPSSPRTEAFTLVFRGNADQPLTQGEYRFEHDALGEFTLFIVPVGGDTASREYEAIINRLRDPQG